MARVVLLAADDAAAELSADQGLIDHLLGTRKVCYWPVFAHLTGGVKTGVLLSQLYYWRNKGASPDGWFFKTDEELRAETAFSRHELESGRKALEKGGWLETSRRGVPPRTYYHLNRRSITADLRFLLLNSPKSGELIPESLQFSENRRINSPKSGELSITDITSEITNTPPIVPHSKSPNPEKVTPQDFADGWNEICGEAGFSKVARLSSTRIRQIRARMREHPDTEFWSSVFSIIKRSPFLRGEQKNGNSSHPNWRASFDWLIANDTNCLKVYEGKYDGQAFSR